MPTHDPIPCEHPSPSLLLVCPTCNRIYPCKNCHDKTETHLLIQKKIQKILCVSCGCIQPKTQTCIQCKNKLSNYFCLKCTVWCDSSTIYHCNKCNVCRVGPKEKYKHCDGCKACIEVDAKEHIHIPDSIMSNCPICADFMFDSGKQAILLKCGHAIHEECYLINLKNSMNCAICFKIVGDDGEIRKVVKEILECNKFEGVKNEEKEKDISCFECGKSCKVKEKMMFNECVWCGSYNTRLNNEFG